MSSIHFGRRFLNPSSGGISAGPALARRLVEMHGGTIEARSDGEGLGSVFTISFPSQTTGRTTVRMNLGEMQKALDAAEEPDLNGSRILIVDDDADVRDLLAIRLQEYGGIVERADSVKTALEMIRDVETRPDLIVSDIAMPGEDGYSLMRKVRALSPEDGGNIPAIALTAYSRVKDRIDALAAGYQMHLSKPVDTDELALGVSSILERYGRTGK
jgi:CheY-like chemotaxis protein